MMHTLKFKSSEEDTRNPEQKEEAKKRLEEMIESWRKFEQEYPKIAKDIYC